MDPMVLSQIIDIPLFVRFRIVSPQLMIIVAPDLVPHNETLLQLSEERLDLIASEQVREANKPHFHDFREILWRAEQIAQSFALKES